MKHIITRLIAAALSLALVAPVAQAQGIDPAARGLAVQAKAAAPAVVAAKGGNYVSLAPAGLSAPRRRHVIASFIDNFVGFATGGGTTTYTTEAFPVAAPTKQQTGAKIVLSGTAAGGVKTNAFVQNTSQPSPPLPTAISPSVYGSKPFVKAPGQILYALIFLPNDTYYVNGYSYIDNVALTLMNGNGANSYSWNLTTSNQLKSGWNMLMFRWDTVANSVYDSVPAKVGAINDGDTVTQALIAANTSNPAGMTFYVAEIGYYDGPPTAPMLIQTFDGAYTTHNTLALPALQARGLKALFTTGSSYYMNDPSWTASLAAAGMEIGHQMIIHNLDYPQSGDARYTTDIDRAIQYMQQLGYDWRVGSMAYDDITRSQATIGAGRGMRFIREYHGSPGAPIVEWGFASGLPNVGDFGSDSVTANSMKAYIDKLVRYGGLGVILTHQTITGGNGSTSSTAPGSLQTYIEDLTAVWDYAKARGVKMVTAGDLVRSVDAMTATTYP